MINFVLQQTKDNEGYSTLENKGFPCIRFFLGVPSLPSVENIFQINFVIHEQGDGMFYEIGMVALNR